MEDTDTPKDRDRKKTMRKKNIGLINQEILKLVARGSAVICEILRLKDYIPEPYSNKNEEKLYKDIIFDFSIFKQDSFDKFETRLKADQELLDKDEDFRINNIEIIERFFALFDSIYQYITDWKTFIDQINQGKFVQHTVDTILTNKDLRPLFCESVFSAGVMLLLVDRLIPGPIREKLIVSYYRYKGQSTIPHFQDIFKLFANTGYYPPTSFSDPKDEIKPKKYPVDYFKRCELNVEIIQKVVGTINGNDIYDQQTAYPTTSEYQTLAFSQQAGLLVITLFFCPRTLEKDKKIMFDIVSKHFHDNFVISFYMGYTIDINEYWKDFKEAHIALDFNMKSNILKDNKTNKLRKIKELDNKIKDYLIEGVMTEEYVLKNIEILLNIMRDSNLVLRWFILQRNITKKTIRDLFNDKLENNDIVNLLLNLSQFEYLLKTMFQNLVFNKESMWESDKSTCIQKLSELILFYSGNTAFNANVKLDNYSKYFEDLSAKINLLDPKNPTKVGVRIGKIKDMINGIKALDKVSESVNAKENLRLINERLDHMLMLVNVKKNYLVNISKISDFSYAWIYIHDYSLEMQRLLRKDSKNVLLLRATFLKLASILNFPLIRLFEIESDDIESVTNYYSGELVKFVKDILQVIPRRVFELMKEILCIFETNSKLEMPLKILKKDFKDYAQPNDRFKLAKAIHGISMITKGIFMMEKTLMGVIEVDPKVILEEGIREELLKLLAQTFHKGIDFGPGDKIDLTQKLNKLILEISSLKKSFIYIQDYVNMNGTKMWSEEMHRLINYYVELEANRFLSRKIKHKKDKYEMFKYKIPQYPSNKNTPETVTFLGRLTRYILNLTEPKNITFCPFNYTWYEKDKLDKEIFGIKTLYKIKKALGVEGFQGFGKLLGYINFQNLVRLQSLFNSRVINDSNTIRIVNKQFESPYISHMVGKAEGKELINNIKKYNPKKSELVMEKLLNIGQIEFLRKMQNYILSENSEVDCYILNTEMKSMDKINLLILKNDIKVNFASDDANAENNNQGEPLGKELNNNSKENSSLDNYYSNLCSFLEDFGYVDTEHTFFQNLNSLNYMPTILAVTTFNSMKTYLEYDKNKMILKKKNADFDINYFTHGIFCILYQTGKKNLINFIAMLSELLRLHLSKKKDKEKKIEGIKNIKKKQSSSIGEGNPEVTKYIPLLQYVLQELADNTGIRLDYFEMNLNSFLMCKNIATIYKIEPPKKKKK